MHFFSPHETNNCDVAAYFKILKNTEDKALREYAASCVRVVLMILLVLIR